MRALAQGLGIANRVLFPGLISGDLKLAALVDADLFVLPSYAENFGGVIIEALACGLPVVISDQVNIHRELLDAGIATVVTSSIDAVAEGIESALADTGRAAASPHSARRLFVHVMAGTQSFRLSSLGTLK